MTLPEVVLWQELRRERFKGWRFRRQMPIGPYVIDFGCARHKVIVEVDGAFHDIEERVLKDEIRSAFLQSKGYALFRIRALDVLRELDAVLDGLTAFLSEQERRGDLPPSRPLDGPPPN